MQMNREINSLDAYQLKQMFLRGALEKIVAEKDVKRQQHAQLRKACESALGECVCTCACANHAEELSAELQAYESEHRHQQATSSSAIVPSLHHFINADRYFLPFELACASKSPRIVVIALDCLQVSCMYKFA
jgi:brefeldin A-inhibited guanine nucleotide-exchange protein